MIKFSVFSAYDNILSQNLTVLTIENLKKSRIYFDKSTLNNNVWHQRLDV